MKARQLDVLRLTDDELQAEIRAWFVKVKAAGQRRFGEQAYSWSAISRGLGVSVQAAQNWATTSPPKGPNLLRLVAFFAPVIAADQKLWPPFFVDSRATETRPGSSVLPEWWTQFAPDDLALANAS